MNFDLIKTLDTQLKRKGVIMIVWGWVMAINYLIGYLVQNAVFGFEIRDFFRLLSFMLGPVALIITLVFLYRVRDKARRKMYVEISYIWVSLLIALVLVNLILANILHEVKFELQHPIFMVMIGLTMSMTGRILSFRPLMLGGLIFAILAYVASFLPLSEQMVVESIGWVIAFVIPGHLLYSRQGQLNYYR